MTSILSGHFIIHFRHSFKVISEEIFLLFSNKILSDIKSFLEIVSDNEDDEALVSKSKLQKFFSQNYSWIREKEFSKTATKIDEKCGGLYEFSIYKPIGDNNTFSFKKDKYPIRFQLKL